MSETRNLLNVIKEQWEELCQRCVSCKLLARMDLLKSLNAKFQNPARGSVRIKVEACGICHSDAVTRRELGQAFSTRAYRDMRSPESLMRQATGVAWTPGQRVGVGWHGGHCGYCDSCRRGDFLLAKSRPKCLGSPTTAATPNT